MAWRIAGNQALDKNQTTAPAARQAIRNSTKSRRPRVACANAATPRGVSGCQAKGLGERRWGQSGYHRSFRRQLWPGAEDRVGRRDDEDGEWKTNLHDAVHEHLDVIDASSSQSDISEHGDVDGVSRRLGEGEFCFRFADFCHLVRRDEAEALEKTLPPQPSSG